MKSQLKKFAAAAAFSLALGAPSANAATVVDLAFIMDESGSVAQADYLAAMDSLADALDASIPVGNPNVTYSITVISFSSSTTLDVAPTLISDATALSNVTAAIRAATYSGGGTNYATAFNRLLTEVPGASLGDSSIINMMTDGEASDNGFDERDDLRAAGWDSLSFEAVENFGGSPDSATLAALAFDTNGVGGQPIINNANQISNPLTNSFVLEVAGFGPAYAAAISGKVQRIVNPNPVIPLPAGLPLLLSGIMVLGAARMRKRKAAA